jgi:hypothetical protein
MLKGKLSIKNEASPSKNVGINSLKPSKGEKST